MSDLISRQAAIEVIDAVMPVDPNKSEYASGIACGAALAMTYVKQLPSAQPEWKTGRWIPHEDEDGEHYGDKCSECGEWYVMPYGKTNFCPNCGADMRRNE